MFYTKVVISESVEESYRAVISKRWEFVPLTTSGGTKARRFTAGSDWNFVPVHTFEDYNSQESQQEREDTVRSGNILPNETTYIEEVRSWESAAIAQDFVTAVQALNLTGVTISYNGDTDPTAV